MFFVIFVYSPIIRDNFLLCSRLPKQFPKLRHSCYLLLLQPSWKNMPENSLDTRIIRVLPRLQ